MITLSEKIKERAVRWVDPIAVGAGIGLNAGVDPLMRTAVRLYANIFLGSPAETETTVTSVQNGATDIARTFAFSPNVNHALTQLESLMNTFQNIENVGIALIILGLGITALKTRRHWLPVMFP